MLKGKYVCICYPTDEDAKKDWVKWINDPEINSLIGRYPWPNAKSDQKKYIDEVRRNKERLILGIKLKKNYKMSKKPYLSTKRP